jgi:hypothetical protein
MPLQLSSFHIIKLKLLPAYTHHKPAAAATGLCQLCVSVHSTAPQLTTARPTAHHAWNSMELLLTQKGQDA